MKRNHFFLLVALFILFLASCQGDADTLAPPEIRYGEDVCDHCNMIINEPRFAAAYLTEEGDSRRFDDIGEMLLSAYQRDDNVRAYWVHDFDSEEWVDAAQAQYVHNPDLMTPMGWGLAAFAAADAAQDYSAENGLAVLTFAELQEQIQHGELAPQGMARHDH